MKPDLVVHWLGRAFPSSTGAGSKTRLLLEIAAVLLLTTGHALAQTPPPADRCSTEEADPPPPLTFRFGDVDLRFHGFVDATAVMRSTNVGSGIGTSFGSIPFDDVPQGHLSETRLSAQNSRVSLLVTSTDARRIVKGYLEADFLGNAPANLNVTANANTLRMRLYWLQYRHDKVEFVGGQSWSLLTPSRNGISATPSDVFFSQNVDANYQVGFPWARQAQFRFVVHATETIAAALSLENPQQFVGQSVVLPSRFDGGQVDASGNATTPNPYPDVVMKMTFDPRSDTKRQHVEVAGLLRGFSVYDRQTGGSFSRTGRGASVHVNLQPVARAHFIAGVLVSDGGGRYLFGLGPDFIVNADGTLSLVGARSGIVGSEVQLTRTGAAMIFGYHGTARFDQVIARDSNGREIGHGIVGNTAANKRVDETTIGLNQALFRNPARGALQLMVQYSYLSRTPWWAPSGGRNHASSHMVWINVRFALP